MPRWFSIAFGEEMTPIKTSAAIQRLIASAVAREEEVLDEAIAAKVIERIGDVPPEEFKILSALFRVLKAKAIKELPRMRWGASMTLDDIKVARFAFDAAQEHWQLNDVAVRVLLQETWGSLYGR